LIWRTPRPPAALPRWSFATPLVIQMNGARQIISPAAQMVCSYDPESGKELWKVRYRRMIVPGEDQVLPDHTLNVPPVGQLRDVHTCGPRCGAIT